MAQSKLQTLSRTEQVQLDQLVQGSSELAVADAIGTTRLTVARARLGCRLQTPSREKIRAYLGSELSAAV